MKNLQTKLYVAIGIILNLAMLIYYKYTNFIIGSLSQAVTQGRYHFQPFDIILPIGVSFIVFEKITYLVDAFRGVGRPAKHLASYLNYVFLFPKLLAGPIIKYHEIEKQLVERVITAQCVMAGFKRFLYGLAKKVFIADSCGSVANQVFALDGQHLGFSHAWLGIICFTLQIYFDFSSYSDMALGLARMLGFQLRENFNMPYIANNFTDFWRRWHISLSTWIREYLYIPLGGNQTSQLRMYTNLWICFLLSGLWHGANWTFVLWGIYNGLFLVLDKLFWLEKSRALPRLLNVAITLILVMFGWVIFRSTDFHQVQFYLHALLFPSSHANTYIDLTPDIFATIGIGSLLVLMPLLPVYGKLVSALQERASLGIASEWFVGILGFFAICKVVGATYTPFLYFQF